MVPAYFAMLWSEEIPTYEPADGVKIDVIAGALHGQIPAQAPPDSWASNPDGHLAIWLIKLDRGASWTIPADVPDLNRMLHFFEGESVDVAGVEISSRTGIKLVSDEPVVITNLGGPAEFLMLQGKPIGAPVFQLGPFVMNTPEELQEAFDDYRRTGFGGWPWSGPDPVHARTDGRFALHANGEVEHREMQAQL
jgi:redox-sensitive bicupin YhaK (pirin superfamily)